MTLKRIDAYLSKLGYCARSDVKKFLKTHEVKENDIRIFDVSKKVKHCDITINNEQLDSEALTILMHKPEGIVCSHNDSGKLIYSLLPLRWQNRSPKLSTIGRLDRDTTGAILLSDDGDLNHKLTSPKSVIPKIYRVSLAHPLKDGVESIFNSGTLILKGEEKPLLPAKLTKIDDFNVYLEILEGRYHQVKRMFGAVQNRVLKLHRESFGQWSTEGLKAGEYKIIDFKLL